MKPVSWKTLFAINSESSSATVTAPVIVLHKSGEPLLVISRGGSSLKDALALYPAQTRLARLARFVWSQTLRVGFAPGAANDSVPIDSRAAFPAFLRGQVGDSHLPGFAILAGNPHAPGRRFILLLFDGELCPAVVLKAGCEPAAANLIAREASFLEECPGHLPGIPKVRARFQRGNVAAMAMRFVSGHSPAQGEQPALASLLNAWLVPGESLVPVERLAIWDRLQDAAAGDPLFTRLAQQLAQHHVRPALFHGDLAPWNIKVSRDENAWTVLDWERGEMAGPPGFDWFHFILQPAILVRRQNGTALHETAEEMLSSTKFKAYAHATGLQGFERQWLVIYLLYCRHVLKPAEGSPRVTELLNLLAAHV